MTSRPDADPPPEVPLRPLRADARDNRARILAAADEVFGRGGAAASTEDVARIAGVGIATVFRHFPTKQGLLRAVLVARLEGLRDRARHLAAADADPGRVFVGFFTEVVEGAAHKLTIIDALSEAGGDVHPEGSGEDAGADGPARAGAELREAFGELLRRAQSARAIRDDVALAEVYALMIGASRAAAHVPMDEPTRARVLALTLDALRPPSRP